jgi:hypothetical protein
MKPVIAFIILIILLIALVVFLDLPIAPFSKNRTKGREWWANRPKIKDYF